MHHGEWSWEEEERFEVECIVGKKVSRGVKEDGHRKGTAIYKVLAYSLLLLP